MDQRVRTFLERQGLDPETASEDQINAASVLAAAAVLPDPETDPDAPAPDPAAEVTDDEPEPDDDPIAAEQARQLAEATARVAALEDDAQQRNTRETGDRRDGLATAWVQDGRIAPAERQHYRDLLDVDETRTIALATALAPGRIPVTERGIAATDDTAAATAGLPGHWFPQLQDRQSTTITQEA